MLHKVLLLAAAVAVSLPVAHGSAAEDVQRQRLRAADRRLGAQARHEDSEDENEDAHRTHVLKFSCLTVLATSQDAALRALAKHILAELNAGRGIHAISLEAIESIEGAYAATQSADTAVANAEVITADDVAEQHGGRHDEDLGCKGQCMQFQGDMAASNESQLAQFQVIASRRLQGHRAWAGTQWTAAYVPYCFASDTPANIRGLFELATRQVKRALPCFTFENVGWASGSSTDARENQRCARSPAIFVMSDPGQGCFSYVGMVSGWPSQPLQLHDPGCAGLGTVIHELGHAIGMVHEHERPDRDQYVVINWANIAPEWHFAFTKNDMGYAEIEYDYQSVMHYSPFAFATDYGTPTVSRVSGGHDGVGQRNGLSSYDVTQLETMYQETNAACSANALHGAGCSNLPDDWGSDICSFADSCHGQRVERCCACGGGVQVQCYAGAPCPDAATGRLPPGPERECIETAIDGASGCMFRNRCESQEIEFRCQQRSCTFNAGSGDWLSTDCHGSYLTQICEEPHRCLIWEKENFAAARAGAAAAAAAPAAAPGSLQDMAAQASSPQNLFFAGLGLASVCVCALLSCRTCMAKQQQHQQQQPAAGAQRQGFAPVGAGYEQPSYGFEQPGYGYAMPPPRRAR